MWAHIDVVCLKLWCFNFLFQLPFPPVLLFNLFDPKRETIVKFLFVRGKNGLCKKQTLTFTCIRLQYRAAPLCSLCLVISDWMSPPVVGILKMHIIRISVDLIHVVYYFWYITIRWTHSRDPFLPGFVCFFSFQASLPFINDLSEHDTSLLSTKSTNMPTFLII